MSAQRMFRVGGALLLAVALSPATLPVLLQAQQPPAQPSQPGAQPSRPSPSAPARPTVPAPRQPERKIIYVSGRVIMEDGAPPPERVGIERVCGGNSRREGHTDSRGYFSIQLGDNREAFQDASTSSVGFSGSMDESLRGPDTRSPFGGVTENELMTCELRAVLAGYRSSLVPLAGRRQFDNPDVGVLVLFDPARARGTIVSALSLKAPRSARKAFDQGRKAISRERWSEAAARFQQAIAEYPEYAEAWYEIGTLHHRQGQAEEAMKAYRRAHEIEPQFVKPLYQMAELTAQAGLWAESARFTRRVLELDPISFPRVYFLDAVANYNLGNLDQAEKSARRGHLFLPPQQNPRLALLLGTVLLRKNDYKGAAEGFKAYLQHAPDAPDSVEVRNRLQEIQEQLARPPQPVAAAPR